MFDYRKLAEACGTPYEIWHGEYKGVFIGEADPIGGGYGIPHYRFPGGVCIGGNKIKLSVLESERKRMLDEEREESLRFMRERMKKGGKGIVIEGMSEKERAEIVGKPVIPQTDAGVAAAYAALGANGGK